MFQGAPNKTARVVNGRFSDLVDMERLREEISKLKVENSIIKKDQIETKAENKRLEEDYKKSVKILEEILKEGGSAAHEVLNGIIRNGTYQNNQAPDNREGNLDEEEKSLETVENNLNDNARFNLSTNTFFRLKEMFMINSLKNQITELKQVNKRQKEEIENFKNSSRVIKLHKLEQDFTTSSNELTLVKNEYETMRVQYEGTLEKYKVILEEKNYFKVMMQKYKSQFEDAKLNLKNSREEIINLKETRRNQDERIIYLSKITKPTSYHGISLKNNEGDKEKDGQTPSDKNDLTNPEYKSKGKEILEIKVNMLNKENRELVGKLE